MDREIISLLNHEVLSGADVGFILERIDGEVIFQYNADVPLIPASNLKILTGLAGLLYLGPDFRFETKFLMENYEDGRISNLYVIGSGDPTLVDYETLEVWCRLLINYGSENVLESSLFSDIKEINGNIIVDDYLFDDEFYNKEWDVSDLSQSYAAQVSALTINRNTVTLCVKSNDTKIEVHEVPNVGYVNVFSDVKVSNNENVKIERKNNTNDVYLKGTVLPNVLKYYSVTVHDPALYTGYVLKNMLHRNGIKVNGKVLRGMIDKISDVKVKIIKSQRLSVIVRDMMKYSINLYADNIAKTVSAKIFGSGSWKNWHAVVHRMLKEFDVPYDGTIIVDGSGLSHKNRVSPKVIAEILRKVYTEGSKDVKESFINSLPIAGVDGTLKKRMNNTPAEGRIKAKTGTLNNVSALSGYVETLDKEILVFSFISNNVTSPEKVKLLEDRLANVLINV